MSRRHLPAAAAGLTLLIALTGCTSAGFPPQAKPSAASPTSTAQASVADVAAQLAPSVVTILTGNGNGSGVVYRDDGHIITNEHVVRGATAVTVVFADATQSPARVIATDPISDIALVQTHRRDLPATTGVLVTAVTPNGPAAQAKITAGSVIQQLAGTPTPTVETFLRVLRQHDPGQRVRIVLVPPGQRNTTTLDLVLTDRPQ